MSTPTRIPVAAPLLGEREEAYVLEALRSGWVSSLGPFLDRFEAAFASYVGARHAISVCNGTVALHVLLHAMGIGRGDEVIVPDLTFAASGHAVLQVGATPVLADVDEDTGNLSPVAVERAISPRTRAIMAVHLYGHPADMDPLATLARDAGAALLEDAAEAHGAEYGGKRVGSIGRAGTFSFYGNKLMTTGEGGMVVTDDDALAERVRFLKDHGMSPARRYFHTELAFNYRMTNLQAALGLAQLERLEDFIARRRAIYARYADGLRGVEGIELNVERPRTRNVYWMICLQLTREPEAREDLASFLRARGIDSRPFFEPLSDMPHFASMRRVGATGAGCPVAARLSRRGLNLPSGSGMSDDDVDRVIEAVRAWRR